MLAYGIEIDNVERYGVAVEAALEDLRRAAACGAPLTRLRRDAEHVGCTRAEIATAISEGRTGR